jgi:hypothetical protein
MAGQVRLAEFGHKFRISSATANGYDGFNKIHAIHRNSSNE